MLDFEAVAGESLRILRVEELTSPLLPGLGSGQEIGPLQQDIAWYFAGGLKTDKSQFLWPATWNSTFVDVLGDVTPPEYYW